MDKEQVYGLYGQSWRGLVTKGQETIHPAKFSRRLIYWIVRTGLERGWWNYGDAILDPFAGIGLGGIACADYYLRWLGVELEEKFYDAALSNFSLHRERWLKDNCPLPGIIRYDSRRITDVVLGSHELRVITSPPFSEPTNRDNYKVQAGVVSDVIKRAATNDRQGTHPDNIARLSIGAITSPPYQSTEISPRYFHGSTKSKDRPLGYGDTEGQIGDMPEGIITSPPYGNRVDDHGPDKPSYEGQAQRLGEYGTTSGQIGHMGVVTSPPYGNVRRTTEAEDEQYDRRRPPGVGWGEGSFRGRYPGGGENIGNNNGETYWSAIEQILAQLYEILTPGGHVAWVVKQFVRKKRVVDLPMLTHALMVDVGFEPVAWIDAMLVNEDGTREYKSFWRRLAEKKGSPRIDQESVLVMKKC